MVHKEILSSFLCCEVHFSNWYLEMSAWATFMYVLQIFFSMCWICAHIHYHVIRMYKILNPEHTHCKTVMAFLALLSFLLTTMKILERNQRVCKFGDILVSSRIRWRWQVVEEPVCTCLFRSANYILPQRIHNSGWPTPRANSNFSEFSL